MGPIMRMNPHKRINTHFTRLDYIVELNGNEVKLTEKPENIVFLEK